MCPSGFSSSSDSSLPEEFRFLCMLHNIGATTQEHSLTIEEIAKWTSMEISVIRVHLRRLMEMGYVESTRINETDKYNLTHSGIRKVLSLYS
ncbi:helix-turn-helix transcriptional regulator [Candidatus Bathyarchaeota archaeon]|nr:helix-turn-helix transcriptional regulator [Candidatus Bathyarchaeota archaeon]